MMHLDQREEVCIIGLIRAAAEGEYEVEKLRQRLCENPDFEPYSAFKALQQRPLTSGVGFRKGGLFMMTHFLSQK